VRALGAKVGVAVPTVTAGAVIGLVEVVVASSFAALIFGGRLSGRVADGVGLNLGAAAVVLVSVALLSGRQRVVGSTQDTTAAILAVIAAGVAASVTDPDTAFLSVVAAIAVAAVLSGGVLLLLGALRLGGLVRFVPYPVVGGFLAGTGWLLAKGSIEVMTQIVPSLDTLDGVLSGDAMTRLLPGAAFGVLLVVATRLVRTSLTIPALVAAGVVIFYVALFAGGTSVDAAEADGWLLGPFPKVGLWQPWTARAVTGADWSAVTGEAGGIATVALVAGLSLLLNASGIEIALRRDLDLNRELRTAGVANAAAGLAGGVPGFHALSLTALVRRLGADARWTAIVAAAVCLAALAFGSALLSLFPRVVLGGLLLFLGLEFLVEWVWDARRTMPRGEHMTVLLILVAIAVWGLLPGVAVGLVLAVVLFAVSYSRTDLVRQAFTASTFRSNVERAPSQRRLLREVGTQVQILRLQGFVFFGTANSLLERVRARSLDPEHPLRFMVLDFRRVTGLDSSAVLSFVKAGQLAATARFELVLTSVPAEVRTQLELGGVVRDGVPLFFAPDLDRGVQHCEDALLAAARHGDAPLDVIEPAVAVLGEVDPDRLAPYLTTTELAEGATLFRQGDPPDALFLLDAGRLTVQLVTGGGETVRLRTLGPGTVVGEIAMYLGTTRTATIVAETPCDLRRLSSEDLARMERDEPELAASLHRAFVGLMAERLSETLTTIETLVD